MTHTGWHDGELALQREVGVDDSDLLRRGVRDHLPPLFMQFTAAQRMAVTGTMDDRDRIWASVVSGAPGFLRAADSRTIELNTAAAAESGIVPHLRAHPTIGVLVFDPETRRRIRINGTPAISANGDVTVHVRESFGNCQQYVQKRRLDQMRQTVDDQVEARSTASLNAGQRQSIAQADTFFIASYHPATGADASHRGGRPGFVRAVDATTVIFPDYSGNNMFQTLGNLRIDPRAGLLFVDFESGRTLQLTGTARESTRHSPADFPGALRIVEYRVERVLERARGSALLAVLVEYSPFNPG